MQKIKTPIARKNVRKRGETRNRSITNKNIPIAVQNIINSITSLRGKSFCFFSKANFTAGEHSLFRYTFPLLRLRLSAKKTVFSTVISVLCSMVIVTTLLFRIWTLRHHLITIWSNVPPSIRTRDFTPEKRIRVGSEERSVKT